MGPQTHQLNWNRLHFWWVRGPTLRACAVLSMSKGRREPLLEQLFVDGFAFVCSILIGQGSRYAFDSKWKGDPVIRRSGLFLLVILASSHHALGESFVAGDFTPVAMRDRSQVNASAPAIDPSGRFVVFLSLEPFLLEERAAGLRQVYLYDHQDGSYELISVAKGGFRQYDGNCYYPAVSAHGRYVTFLSSSRQLVEGDSTGSRYAGSRTPGDCFVRDRLLRETVRVSVSSVGEEANGGCSWERGPDISDNGRYIVFASEANNLVENDDDDAFDVFTHDLNTGTTRLVSVWPDGSPITFDCLNPSMTSDGRYVAFEARYGSDIFVRDTERETTEVIVSDCKGEIGLVQLYWYSGLQISDDGRFLLFACLSNRPVPHVAPAWGYIYLFDRETREMAMVAALAKPPGFMDPLGLNLQETGGYQVMMSGNGRYVFFSQWEGNHNELRLYRYDRLSKSREEVVYASPVPRAFFIPWWVSRVAAVNRDGSVLAFATESNEFYPSFIRTILPREGDLFRLFRVELWDTPSGVSRWAYHR